MAGAGWARQQRQNWKRARAPGPSSHLLTQREWKESNELRHSFSNSWFVNKICAMNSYALLWFYNAPQKKIQHKPPVILYWDKLKDFSNKHLYSKNVLLVALLPSSFLFTPLPSSPCLSSSRGPYPTTQANVHLWMPRFPSLSAPWLPTGSLLLLLGLGQW